MDGKKFLKITGNTQFNDHHAQIYFLRKAMDRGHINRLFSNKYIRGRQTFVDDSFTELYLLSVTTFVGADKSQKHDFRQFISRDSSENI